MVSKKRVRKIIILSTAIKMIFTLAGLLLVQISGIQLPNPLAMVETHLSEMISGDVAEEVLTTSHGSGKWGRGPYVTYHVV